MSIASGLQPSGSSGIITNEKGFLLAQMALSKLLASAMVAAKKAIILGPKGQSKAAGNQFNMEELGVELEDIANDAILRLARAGLVAFSLARPDIVEVRLREGLRGLYPYLVTTMQNLLTDKAKISHEYERSIDEPLRSAEGDASEDACEATLKETIPDRRATKHTMARMQLMDLARAIDRLTPMERFYFLMSNLPALWDIREYRPRIVESVASILEIEKNEAEKRLDDIVATSEQARGDVLSTKEIIAFVKGARQEIVLSIQAVDTGYSRASKTVKLVIDLDDLSGGSDEPSP
jgi:hypothetical protein